jgi:hypothetical protein
MCVCVSMYLYVYIYICMYICVCGGDVYIHFHICIYVHIHTDIQSDLITYKYIYIACMHVALCHLHPCITHSATYNAEMAHLGLCMMKEAFL